MEGERKKVLRITNGRSRGKNQKGRSWLGVEVVEVGKDCLYDDDDEDDGKTRRRKGRPSLLLRYRLGNALAQE